MDLGGFLGAGLGFVSSLIQGAEERRRRNKALRALEGIMLGQRQDFAEAAAGLREGAEAYRTNPDRLALLKRYREQSETSPFGADYQSSVRQAALDQSGQQQAMGMGALRERLQRAGLGSSGVGVAAQMAYGQNSWNQALGRVNEVDIGTRRLDADYRRQGLDAYQQLLEGSAQNEYTFKKDYANLLASKQYGNSALFSAAYG